MLLDKAIVILAALSALGVIVMKKRFFALLAALFVFSALFLRSAEALRPFGIGMLESILVFALALFIRAYISDIDHFAGKMTLLFGGGLCALMAWMTNDFYYLKPIMPALRSPLFYLHIPLFFAGYACLSYQTARAIKGKTPRLGMAVSFIFAGIITGGIWAHYAWGFAWSWDPKETWSLITMLILIMAEHIDNPKWKRIFTIIAFLAMLFTFIGIAFFFTGLHSYQSPG
ncbi:MAG: cytochrome c biogenesis protein CcsA [Candidatus Zixiibacteriota bacterium]